MPIALTQNHLIQLLNSWNFNPVYEKESDQIYIFLKIAHYEVPVFFGIRSGDQLLQTIAYLPFQLLDLHLGQVARLLHLLNRELDMPGFGMDEVQKLLFYRIVIPCINKELNEKVLELQLATTKVAIETFMDAIAMVLTGKGKVEDLLKSFSTKNER